MGNKYLFGKPKRSNTTVKVIAGAAAAAVALGVFMNLPDREDSKNPDNANLIVNADAAVTDKNDRKQSDKDKENAENKPKSQNGVVTQGGEAYYLLKEAEGQIELYHYDEDGREQFIRMTDIPFSLISPADQELFREGIVLKDENELDTILQDFES